MNLETLLDALRLTVIGMGVVFAALFVLSLLMSALPILTGRPGGQAGKSGKEKQQTPAVVESSASVAESAAAVDRSGVPAEMVAVIATAIAAYLGQAPDNLNIVSIRRASASMGPWALAARRESIQN